MRWLQCAKSAPFPFVIGAHFVDKFFSEESRESAQSLIDDVRVAFAAGINASDWLDEETKARSSFYGCQSVYLSGVYIYRGN